MNFVFLSPHFPPNYSQFCVHLNNLGVNVLGLADEPYDDLSDLLRTALTEYYKVGNLHNYDELLRAVGFLTYKYGKIDRLDSLNEYWLETEAQLRTDFNVWGINNEQIQKIKKKSLMKDMFIKAGVPVARGNVVTSMGEARALIDETGFPVVAKPDIGVGAARTYKIHDPSELSEFFATKPDIEYIMEEFVSGVILSFDGLVDQDGKLVFYTSHQYSQGIMETVVNDDLVHYYSLRDVPKDLETAGRRVLKVFEIRERFFHFEFFRRHSDGKIVALEVNMRPPGGLTTDMFNYANDIDIYGEWAHVVVHNHFTSEVTRPYHCCYVGRKFNRRYTHSHSDILERMGAKLCHHESISGVFSAALGNYGYLVRSPDLEEIKDMVKYIQTTVSGE
jgi:biotin carboxylase